MYSVDFVDGGAVGETDLDVFEAGVNSGVERRGDGGRDAAREHELCDAEVLPFDCLGELALARLVDTRYGGWFEVCGDGGEEETRFIAAKGVTVASGGEEEVDGVLVPVPSGSVEGGFVVATGVFEEGLIAEELGDDGGVAPCCGSVQYGVAVPGIGVGWRRTAVLYVCAGGEGGGQEGAVAFLRGEEEDVVFVFRDEEPS